MSMPCTILYCDTCDYQRHNTALWGDYAYLSEGVEVPLERVLAWCHKCKSFSAIEDFTNLNGCVSHLTKSIRSLEVPEGALAALANVLIPARRKANAEAIRNAQTCSLRVDLIRARKGSERCLECGSTEWAAFGDDATRAVNSVGSSGEQRTGFIHPECGGEIIAKPYPWRLNCAFQPQRYEFDGTRTEPSEQNQ